MFTISSSPLISIIMPTYNRANFIIETIESIQKQTYRNWELLIIDDGSTDTTAELVENINDQRIYYYKEQHLGMENARLAGVEKASGELVGFMDSDDLWTTTKLEKQVKIFKEYPEIAFCLTGGYEFKKQEEPLVFFYKQKTGLRLGDLFTPFFKSEVVATPQTLVFKRKCLDAVRFPECIELAHIHFILALAKQFKGAILYEPLLMRRLHNSNYSTLHQTKRHYDGIALIKHYKNQLPRKIFLDAVLKSHINFGEECLKTSQKRKAIHEFLQAWKYQPLNIIPAKKIAKACYSFFK